MDYFRVWICSCFWHQPASAARHEWMDNNKPSSTGWRCPFGIFHFLTRFRLSGKLVTSGPFRGLALRHAGSQSIFGSAFFGQTILVFSDFLSSTLQKKKRKDNTFSEYTVFNVFFDITLNLVSKKQQHRRSNNSKKETRFDCVQNSKHPLNIDIYLRKIGLDKAENEPPEVS